MTRPRRWWRNFQQELNAAAVSMARGAHALVPVGGGSPVELPARSGRGGARPMPVAGAAVGEGAS